MKKKSKIPVKHTGFKLGPDDPSLQNSGRDASLPKTQLKPTFIENIWNMFNYVAVIALVMAVVYVICKIYITIQRYKISKDILAVVNLVQPTSPTVGETITCSLRFKKKDGKILKSASSLFKELQEDIIIEINNGEVPRKVAVLREFDRRRGYIAGKFSVRKSGIYEIKVKYHTFNIESESHMQFEVYPGTISPKFTDFETHNPNILCTTAERWQHFKIMAQDEYGNACREQDLVLEKFDFKIYYMTKLYHAEQEFCYHQCDDADGNESSSNTNNAQSLMNICLRLKLNEPGVYHCVLKYGNYVIRDTNEASKLLVCISPTEESELKALFSEMKIPGTLFYTSECKMSLVGDEEGLKQHYVGVSPTSLVFAQHALPLRVYPDVRFPINGKTRITHTVCQTFHSETLNLKFLIQDGVQESVRVEMPSSSGGLFLVAFAHSQGFLQAKRKKSFQELKDSFKVQLYSYFFWFRSEKVMLLEREHLVESTMRHAPTQADDWLRPFKIDYGSVSANNPNLSKQRVQEWINRLNDELFGVRGNTSGSLFQKCSGSQLLHPVPSKISQRPLEIYRLAGQIFAKAIVETVLRGLCTRLNEVRLTRSALAYILGVSISFKFLETDEPRYFYKILSVLESDLTGDEYKFTTTSSSSSTNMVNLIPNGSKIAVTNSNKEHYMNMLTHYRLIHTVEQEITAFRNGFYDVIAKDKLSDFQVFDLQKLIAGGHNFNVEELKIYHRPVKEVENEHSQHITKPSVNTKKLLNWFWTAIENMSEDEQSQLMFFVTGSFTVPSCGLAHLNPKFTISFTGTYNKPPKSNPNTNEIVLGNHASFDSFERSLLHAIKLESDKLMSSGLGEMLPLQPVHNDVQQEEEEEESDLDDNIEITDTEDASTFVGSIVNCLRIMLTFHNSNE